MQSEKRQEKRKVMAELAAGQSTGEKAGQSGEYAAAGRKEQITEQIRETLIGLWAHEQGVRLEDVEVK